METAAAIRQAKPTTLKAKLIEKEVCALDYLGATTGGVGDTWAVFTQAGAGTIAAWTPSMPVIPGYVEGDISFSGRPRI